MNSNREYGIPGRHRMSNKTSDAKEFFGISQKLADLAFLYFFSEVKFMGFWLGLEVTVNKTDSN